MTDAVVADLSDRPASHWIGPAIPVREIVVIMGVAVVASLISQLLPILLNGMAEEGRLTTQQVGQAATLELTALGIVTTLAVSRLPYNHIRPILAVNAIIALAANLATLYAPNATVVFIARSIHGACGGIFLWQLIGMLVRSTLTARMNGIFLGVQGLAGLAMSSLYSAFVIPRFGTGGGFVGLALICAVALVASRWLPRSYAPLHAGEHGAVKPTGPGWIALASIFMSMVAVIGTWIYLPHLALQFGYPASVARMGVPLAIAMQIAGGLTAAALASSLSYNSVTTASLLGFVALVALMTAVPSAGLFLFGMAAFGFLWMFMVPFQFPYTVGVDPSRNTMMFVSPAQLLGCGAGPLLTSLGVAGEDVRGAVIVGAASFVVCLILFLIPRRVAA